ncbi:hypothetical protein ACEVJL_14975 [Pseudoflavonifractor sp. P01025]|uniref:hypothetical protein n=1 Tax=Eubacteriales TaxID=186802 RepID=UPI0009F51810|nr:hypothetical protein [Angelakisella massiliensis]
MLITTLPGLYHSGSKKQSNWLLPQFCFMHTSGISVFNMPIQRIAPAEHPQISAGATDFLVVLFGVFAIGVFPIFSRFHESSIIMGADVLQRLLVLPVFIAVVVEK